MWAHLGTLAAHSAIRLWSLWAFLKETKDLRFVRVFSKVQGICHVRPVLDGAPYWPGMYPCLLGHCISRIATLFIVSINTYCFTVEVLIRFDALIVTPQFFYEVIRKVKYEDRHE